MKPPILVGIVLAAILLIAMFLPRSMPVASATSVGATRQAEAARRMVHRYSPMLPLSASRVGEHGLREADFAKLAQLAEAPLQSLNQRLGEQARAAQELNRRAGIGSGGAQVSVQATETALKSALTGFDKAVSANQQLLAEADKLAKAASASDAQQSFVQQVAGEVAYVKAAGAVAEAMVLRDAQSQRMDALLEKVVEWKAASAEADHYASLETSDALDALRKEIAGVQTQLEDAAQVAQHVDQAVAARSAELDTLRSTLQSAREELARVEAQKFRMGDDASFRSYCEAFERISSRLRDLQEREQVLAQGGRPGAQLEGDALDEAAVVGGEAVTGLETLKRQQALAGERRRKLQGAIDALQKRVTLIEQTGQAAKTERARFAERAKTARAQIDQLKEQVENLGKSALEKENTAMKVARDAHGAFRNAAAAADARKAAAGSEQSKSDPNRLNERLKKIAGDHIGPMIGQSGGAAARLLIGHACAEASDALARYLTVTDEVNKSVRDITFDRKAAQDALQTVRDEGVKALGDARDTYQGLAGGGGNAARMANGSLSALYMLLARLEPAAATAHRTKAVEAIQAAVDKAERHPATETLVQYRNAIRGEGPPPKADEPKSDENKDENGANGG
ncbi:MAG: hypothetical protein U1D55_13665 [Phycisphaerae bacterium]